MVWAGLILFGVGALILFYGVGKLRDAERRLLAHRLASAKSPRDAAPGELVKLRGRVALIEPGPLEAPVSGEPAVWFRVIGSEDESTSGESSFRQFMDEIEDKPFLVTTAEPEAPDAPGDDAASVRVRIGSSAHPALDEKRATSSGPVTGVPPRMQAFLERKGVAAKTDLGFERRREYKEERLSPGDEVLVIGPKPSPPASPGAAYREAPTEPESMAPVLVTTTSDAALESYAAGELSPKRAVIAIAMTLAGALLLAISLIGRAG